MHEFQAFPKWKYHASKEAVIVESKEAESALGDEWVDSPADVVSASSDASDIIEKIGEIIHAPVKLKRKAKA